MTRAETRKAAEVAACAEPFRCLKCGAPLADKDEARDHRAIQVFGPNTCRRVAKLIKRGATKFKRRGRTKYSKKPVKDVSPMAQAGDLARKRWFRVERSGAWVVTLEAPAEREAA